MASIPKYVRMSCICGIPLVVKAEASYRNWKNVEHCGASDEYAEIVYFGREVDLVV